MATAEQTASDLLSCLEGRDSISATGRVRRLVGLVVELEGLSLPIGAVCRIQPRSQHGLEIEAEVVGFQGDGALAIPCGVTDGIAPGDPVHYEGGGVTVRLSDELRGRVLDGSGTPIDGGGPIRRAVTRSVEAPALSPLDRQRISEPLSTGVRAIDALLTCGRGQRLGIFAGAGVGKSVLLGMLARNSSAEVNVIGLVGERGREVREFIERDLGPEGLEKSIVVVATSDQPPVVRLRAVRVATRIAEWFRDQGREVLLLVDSITRVALAQREIGLSASEPPTTKAFPPSVFSLLARLLERTGPGREGNITSFYTVLVEGDDRQDPIGDAVRGILDGHIWLSRDLANRGFFPSIDLLESVSRVMREVAGPDHQRAAAEATEDLARYQSVEDLIQLGAYVRGTDPRTDIAIDRRARLEQFLRQTPEESSPFAQTLSQLHDLVSSSSDETEASRG